MNQMESEILKYITNDSGKLIPQRCTKQVLEKRGYLNYLLLKYSDNTTDSLREIIYRFYNHIDKAPVCATCGTPVIFDVGNNQYPTYCSAKCRNTSSEVLDKNKAAVSESLKKAYEERGDEIKSRRAKTLSDKYDETCSSSPFSSKEVQENARETMISKYGVDNIMKLHKYHAASIKTIRKKSVDLWKARGLDIEYTDNNTVIVHDCCETHGDIEMDVKMFNNRTHDNRYLTSTLCPLCRPNYDFSGPELVIRNLLDNLGIRYIANDRTLIKPLEVDFYIPDKKIAIEFNGIYFHSEDSGKSKDYHKNKTESCAVKGVQLIHIWENDWICKQDLITDMLKIKLGMYEHKVMARKCTVKEISAKDYAGFVNRYHLQGNVPSSYKFGLFYDNELISVMGFGRLRKSLGSKHKDGVYELYRYCVKSGYIVSGGASKLFSHAITHIPDAKEIITYAKRDWSDGNLYKSLGFEFIGYTDPGYFWTNNKGDVLSRYATRKDLIAKTEEEKTLSESQIMKARGYFRCYDSGNLKFIYKVDNDEKE